MDISEESAVVIAFNSLNQMREIFVFDEENSDVAIAVYRSLRERYEKAVITDGRTFSKYFVVGFNSELATDTDQNEFGAPLDEAEAEADERRFDRSRESEDFKNSFLED